MKAIRIHGRGGPEQLIYEEVPKPSPKRGEALVRVMAAGVTPTELSWSSAYATRDEADRLPAILDMNSQGLLRLSGQTQPMSKWDKRSMPLPISGATVATPSTLS